MSVEIADKVDVENLESYVMYGDDAVWAMHEVETIGSYYQEQQIKQQVSITSNPEMMALIQDEEKVGLLREIEGDLDRLKKTLNNASDQEKASLQVKVEELQTKSNKFQAQLMQTEPALMAAMAKAGLESMNMSREMQSKIRESTLRFLRFALPALGLDKNAKLSPKQIRILLHKVASEPENNADTSFLPFIPTT